MFIAKLVCDECGTAADAADKFCRECGARGVPTLDGVGASELTCKTCGEIVSLHTGHTCGESFDALRWSPKNVKVALL